LPTGILNGKVIAVTGAGRGIGRDIALLAAREGAAVVVNDLGGTIAGEGQDLTPAQSVVAEITAAGGSAIANGANIADFAAATSIVEDAVARFGRIDAIVNNAGILRDRMFYNMTQAEWHDVINVHLNGYFHVSRAAADHFRKQGSGVYVHFTSASGLIGNVGQSSYSAAKLGVVALSKSIALDMRKPFPRTLRLSESAWPVSRRCHRKRSRRWRWCCAQMRPPP